MGLRHYIALQRSETLTASISTVVAALHLFLLKSTWFWLPMVLFITLDYFSGMAVAAMDGQLNPDKAEVGLYRKLFLLGLFAAALLGDTLIAGLGKNMESIAWQYPYLASITGIWISSKEAVSFLGNTVQAGAISKSEGKRAKGVVKTLRDKVIQSVYNYIGSNYDLESVQEEETD